jgi:Tfp pilus assembly protein PilO
MSYKIKNYIVIAALGLVFVLLFTYFFGLFDTRNELMAQEVQSKEKELAAAQAEQRSFQQAQKDLEALKELPLQPQDFFSVDTRLVKEIKTLEDLAGEIGLKLTLQVSGTSKAAAKAPNTTSALLVVPYTMSLEGSFPKVVSYLNAIEHLPFVTTVQTLEINALPKDLVRTSISAQFYIKP